MKNTLVKLGLAQPPAEPTPAEALADARAIAGVAFSKFEDAIEGLEIASAQALAVAEDLEEQIEALSDLAALAYDDAEAAQDQADRLRVLIEG